jgi:rhamnosyltransferase
MIDNLLAIRAQVSGLVVVDNGSNVDELYRIREARDRSAFTLIENGRNRGLAEGLNQGVRQAIGEGFEWIILFDQDSSITPGFVRRMFATWERHPQRERIGSLHPRYVDNVTCRESFILRANDGGPFKSMTSGALMPAWIFDKIGLFASEYFIDEVDTEFCLRIRAAGYLVADSAIASLFHNIGNSRARSIFGFTFRPTHHSAARRYYISRNRLVVFRKYFLQFPGCVFYSMFDALRETVKCFMGESDRSRKARNFLLGTWDGLVGRMGERQGL